LPDAAVDPTRFAVENFEGTLTAAMNEVLSAVQKRQ
jgi:hypothetical protein